MAGHWLAELDGSQVTVEVPASSREPRRGLRLPRGGPRDHQPDRGRGPRLEPRRDRADASRARAATSCPRTATTDSCAVWRRSLRAARGELPEGVGWRIAMQNHIPLARGLGSSAAATVGGALAGNALAGEPLSTAEILRIACEIEGHPDNAAAALLGGFVVSATIPGGDRGDPVRLAARAARGPVHPRAPAADPRDAGRAAGLGAHWSTRWPTSGRWRWAWPGWRRGATSCSPG